MPDLVAGFIDSRFQLFIGNAISAFRESVQIRKIPPIGPSPFIAEGRLLHNARRLDIQSFIFPEGSSYETLNGGPLLGRQIFNAVPHKRFLS